MAALEISVIEYPDLLVHPKRLAASVRPYLNAFFYLIIIYPNHTYKFKHLMGTPAGIHQALELAESLGIPSTELPWTFDSVLNYLKAEYDPSRKGHKIPLESTTGWQWERFWEEHSKNVSHR